ncbi:hypothetical protein GJR96_02295 [Haloferax sp. MBLA0076]|uniref:Uncharacterized protein n=1 Tax=Haloferax litoreum TaxID=2666140 RepID=A0A6A8GC12_9EURY|nr:MULTISPECIES: hypothetical protein [Haloferax]KAB1194776.1 hypothetical protein Hfx1148_02280 [Haloferax sp. CBA1148]MRX20794.1 hypothetical protein [Haloferax litoreum]
MVPVVGKALEAAIVVLFIGLLTTVMFGGVVPDHRDAVAHELAERTLATATESIEETGTVPDSTVRGQRLTTVDIPRSIRGSTYRIEYDQNASFGDDPNATTPALVLDHPRDVFDRRIPVTLPDPVNVSGTWDSGTDSVVRVVVEDDETTLELVNEGATSTGGGDG